MINFGFFFKFKIEFNFLMNFHYYEIFLLFIYNYFPKETLFLEEFHEIYFEFFIFPLNDFSQFLLFLDTYCLIHHNSISIHFIVRLQFIILITISLYIDLYFITIFPFL